MRDMLSAIFPTRRRLFRIEAENERLKERLAKSERKLGRLRRQLKEAGLERRANPENIIWIMGSPRTGSTWLGQMMGSMKGRREWREPFLGVLLAHREALANRNYVKSPNYLFGEPHQDDWLRAMRELFLRVAEKRYPRFGRSNYLIVKEPNGSMSAPLIMQALPESRLVFLVRDPRDVVASLLDAAKEGTWYEFGHYEASVVEAVSRGNDLRYGSEDDFVRQLARNYATNVSATREAYLAHREGLKAMLRYEDLRAEPFKWVIELHERLGILADENEVRKAVEKHSWENVPEGEKGQGKVHRKAAPGSWIEDLTPKQVKIVEEITAPLLEEFYR